MAHRESQEDLLKRYRQRLSQSQKWRETEGFDKTWKRLKELYAGKHYPSGLSDEDRIAVNISFATINVIFPTISVNRPKTTVLARDSDTQDQALIAEAVLAAWWDAYDVLPEFRLAAKDFLITGHGWVKCGYRFDEGEEDRSPEEMEEEFQEKRGEVDAYAGENPDQAAEAPTDEELRASIPETKGIVHEDHPFAERVSPHDMFVDPEATKMQDVRWIAQRIVRTLEEVKEDPRYEPKARKAVQADRQVNSDYLASDRKSYGDDVSRVTVWEYYDIGKDQLCVFAQGSGGFLVKPMPIPYKGGHPFEQLRNYDIPDQFYPMGDLEGIEPLQEELNKTRSQLMNARKQYARKHLYDEDMFDSAGRAALADPTDGRLVPVKTGQRPLTEAIVPMPINQMPAELFSYSEVIQADMNTVTGLTEYQRGGGPEIRRTATEAAIIQDAVNARSAEKLGIIERAIARISKRLMDLARQYATEEDVVRVIGRQGRKVFVPYTPEDLDADFDFMVEAGSTVPKGEDYRRQQAMSLVQAIQPLIGVAFDPVAIGEWILEQFGIKDPSKFMMKGMPGMPPGMDPSQMPPGMDPSQMPPGMPPEGGDVPAPEGPPGMAGMENGPAPPTPESAIAGVPPELLQQLAGQVGYVP